MKAVCALLLLIVLAGCGTQTHRKIIVIGVDGMDPGFVERHWNDLPNLKRLKFSRLATTTPPQSPVAWSTFITGLDPEDHGIFDFVHRDPKTRELFLSTDRTLEPRLTLSLGPYEIPLTRSRVESLRKGTAFWQTLSEHGMPVTIVRIPANYPPLPYGNELAGMGTPDLRGTQGTFTFYTDDPGEESRSVAGGLIRRINVDRGHADLALEGPPNSLRKDRAYATAALMVDIDPDAPMARLQVGDELTVLQQGEWSEWMPVDFTLIPHIITARGMIRLFAKQLHPRLELYVSPVNIDPAKQALPISSPESFARDLGRYSTLGIPEDTSALRQGVFDLPQFLTQSRMVLNEEQRLLRESLARYKEGFFFFYFSTVDQNSHILWGKHEAELLSFYRAVDGSVGEVIKREPEAELIVMSDHGFSTFDRAVNLNTWLRQQESKAYAVGLNALYLNGSNRDDLRTRLLAFTDPENGTRVVKTVHDVRPAAANRSVAPDFIVGYSPGYRASWQTALGEAPDEVLETNTDAWIADHCINAADVPGVLFTNRDPGLKDPSLKSLSAWLRWQWQQR